MELAIGASCLLVGFGLAMFFHSQVESEVKLLLTDLHEKIDALMSKAKVKL